MRSSCQNRPEAGQRKEIELGNGPAIPPVCAVKMNDGVALIVLRIDLHTELAAQREHAILPFAKPCAAYRDHTPVGRGSVPHASAHAIARLNQRD
jgi:hypothetical protein